MTQQRTMRPSIARGLQLADIPPPQSATLGLWPPTMRTSTSGTTLIWSLSQTRGAPQHHRSNSRPSVSKCRQSSQTLEHWLQTRPATHLQRLAILGTTDRPLDILTTDPLQVILYTTPWETVLSVQFSSVYWFHAAVKWQNDRTNIWGQWKRTKRHQSALTIALTHGTQAFSSSSSSR